MNAWNQISALQVDLNYADYRGDTDAEEAARYKLDMPMYSVTDELTKAIDWANAQENFATRLKRTDSSTPAMRMRPL